jgi:hypothetical protein
MFAQLLIWICAMDFPKYRISNGKGLLEIGSFDALLISYLMYYYQVTLIINWFGRQIPMVIIYSNLSVAFIISWSVHLILFNRVWKGFVPPKIEFFFVGWLFLVKSILDESWLGEIFLKLVMHFDHYVSRTTN